MVSLVKEWLRVVPAHGADTLWGHGHHEALRDTSGLGFGNSTAFAPGDTGVPILLLHTLLGSANVPPEVFPVNIPVQLEGGYKEEPLEGMTLGPGNAV